MSVRIFTNNLPPHITGVCIGPVILLRPEYDFHTLNHEEIHAQQQKEMLFFGAYILYFLEMFFKFFWYRCNLRRAYRNTSFEREAYAMQNYAGYLTYRKPWSHIKLIFWKLPDYRAEDSINKTKFKPNELENV